jgi:hypothetical protein
MDRQLRSETKDFPRFREDFVDRERREAPPFPDQTKNLAPARSIKSAYSGSGEHDAPTSARLPGKREKPNAKVTDTFTNGVVPAHSRPYYVEDENGGDSIKAHVDTAVTAA